VTSARELDSLPRSEAPTRPGGQAMPSGLPGWMHCDVHRAPFLFECIMCAGAILGYGH